jgi:predicted nuclease of restriction endonuclease-like (RecB) superfamily
LQIDSNTYARQGKAVTNFDKLLPSPQSDLAQQALKGPYIFDCMTIEEPLRERGLEAGLIKHLEKFLLELSSGSAFFTF